MIFARTEADGIPEAIDPDDDNVPLQGVRDKWLEGKKRVGRAARPVRPTFLFLLVGAQGTRILRLHTSVA